MKNYILPLSIATSLLTHNLYAADDLRDLTSGMNFGGPNLNDSLGQRTQVAAKGALSQTVGDVKRQVSTAYQAIRKGGPSADEITEIVMNHLQLAIQRDFVNQYFKPTQTGDFNVEALQKLLRPVREKVVAVLRTSLLSTGNVALGPNGEQYPVVSNQQLLTAFLNKFLPEFPMRGAFLSIANNKAVNNFLMKKIDEFVIRQFLNVYQMSTGRPLKKDVAQMIPQIIAGSAKGIVGGAMALPGVAKGMMADYDDAGELAPLSKEQEEALSKIIQYLEPRLTHFTREIIQTDYLNKIIDKAMTAITDPAIKAALRSESVSSLGNLGAIAGGLASYVNVPLGVTMAGAGYFTGMYLGHFANHMQTQTKEFTLNQLDIYKKYIAYRLLPITAEEYSLYYLSDHPSDDLRNILQDEYKLKHKIQSQSLLWAIWQDMTSLLSLNGVVNVVSGVAQKASDSVKAARDYFANPSGSSMLQFQKGEEDIFVTDRDKKHHSLRKLVAIMTKDPKNLTQHEKEFLKEVERYPSFNSFKGNLEDLNKTIHYLSQKDLKKLQEDNVEKEQKRNAVRQKYKDEIRLIHDFVTEIASDYQQKQMDMKNDHLTLDWIQVEEALTNDVNNLPKGFLPVLKDIAKNHTFISDYLEVHHNVSKKDYIKTMIKAYEEHVHQQDLQQNQEAIKRLEADPISEGLSLREKLMLVQKGAHNALQPVDTEALVNDEKTALKTLFQEVLAHHIAVDLANQIKNNANIIEELAETLSKDVKPGDRTPLKDKMRQAPQFTVFRDIIKDLDARVNVPSEINPNAGGGFIKQAVYNELMNISDAIASKVESLHQLSSEEGFVVVKEQPNIISEPQAKKGGWFSRGGSVDVKAVQPNVNENVKQSPSFVFQTPSITSLVGYEGSPVSHVILSAMVNAQLKENPEKDLLNLVHNPEFTEKLYDAITQRRAFSVLSEEDMEFLQKYKGYILKEAIDNNEVLFYSYRSMIEKLREKAQKNQAEALGLQNVNEMHELNEVMH